MLNFTNATCQYAEKVVHRTLPYISIHYESSTLVMYDVDVSMSILLIDICELRTKQFIITKMVRIIIKIITGQTSGS